MKRKISALILSFLLFNMLGCSNNRELSREEVQEVFEEQGFHLSSYHVDESGFESFNYMARGEQNGFAVYVSPDNEKLHRYIGIEYTYVFNSEFAAWDESIMINSRTILGSCVYNVYREEIEFDSNCTAEEIEQLTEQSRNFYDWKDEHGLTLENIIEHLDLVLEGARGNDTSNGSGAGTNFENIKELLEEQGFEISVDRMRITENNDDYWYNSFVFLNSSQKIIMFNTAKEEVVTIRYENARVFNEMAMVGSRSLIDENTRREWLEFLDELGINEAQMKDFVVWYVYSY